jgi:uncharacterized repeat protein (TIGR03803 family)
MNAKRDIARALVAAIFGSASTPVFSQVNTLTSFSGTNGANPRAGVILSGGILYGTTVNGGANGDGEVFSVPASGGTPTILTSFNNTNGAFPYGGVILSGSTLYGTTRQGGADGFGEVYSIPVGGGTPTILASFDGTHGQNPDAGLILSGGTLYGTTEIGGGNGFGEVFSLPVSGGIPHVLASFGSTNFVGNMPYAGLTLSGSTLYGTTVGGGPNNDGQVYSVPVAGGQLTILATFNGTNGEFPYAGVTVSGSTIYGTAENGGANGDGVVFSVPLNGGAPTILASFNDADGALPFASPILSGNTLYGTAQSGSGGNDDGVVYSLPISGGTPTVLASFNENDADGGVPHSSLTLSGNTLYGTTYSGGGNPHPNEGTVYDGTVFALTVPEPGSVSLLAVGSIGFLSRRRRLS